MPSRAAGWFLALVVLFSGPPASSGEIPKHLSHQGVLTDSTGTVVPNGIYTLDFGIYDAASAGNQLFSQQLQVDVVNGMYNVLLSDNGGSPGTLDNTFQNPTTYLELTIVGVPSGSGIAPGQVLSPRQKLASVPYAFAALRSDPSRVLVYEQQASDSPEIIVHLPTGFDQIEIDLIDVLPVSTTSVDLQAHVSTDSGLSWDTGANDYSWVVGIVQHPSGFASTGQGSDNRILLNHTGSGQRLVNAIGQSFNARLLVQNPGGGNGYFVVSVDANYFTKNSSPLHGMGNGIRRSTTRVTSLRFSMTAGNIYGGKVKVYGLQ